MRRRQLLMALAALPAVTGPAAGQTTDNPDPTDAAEGAAEAAQGTEEETEETTQVLAEVAPGLDLLDYSVEEVESEDRARMTATVRADSPMAVQMSDAFGAFAEEGVSEVSARAVAVEEGETEVSRIVTTVDDAAGMGLATQDSFGVGISTGLSSGEGESVSLSEGLLYGGTTGILGTGLMAWRKSRSDLDEPEEVESLDSDGGLL